MEFRETARKYIKKRGSVNCVECGKDLYYYDDFECTKTKIGNYVFIHKNCLKLRGDK